MDLKNFASAIRELAEEKGVSEQKVLETIELAIAAAYKKDYGKKGQIIRAKFTPSTGDLHFIQVKIVVDETMIKSEEEIQAEEEARLVDPFSRRESDDDDFSRRSPDARSGEAEGEAVRKVRFNPERHIMLEEAKKEKPEAKPGDELEFPLETKQAFGRIASQTAKQVIIQRIREAEREATYGEYKNREGEIVSGTVQRVEGRTVFVDLGRGVGVLPPEEQIIRERYSIGERIKALLILVEKEGRGPGIILSRSHPRFLKKLFELEVPEIPAGSVEIKAVQREPGSRSKVAVMSHDPAIDPVGSMVGQRGVRVSTVMNEIAGEKIDIIEWSDESAAFIAHALSPAKAAEVALDEERREAVVTVPDDQLSLAIGKGGQNVRLAAKLTGWKIDVRPVSRPEGREESGGAGVLHPEEESAPKSEASQGALPADDDDAAESGDADAASQREGGVIAAPADPAEGTPAELGQESKEMARAAEQGAKKARAKRKTREQPADAGEENPPAE